MILSIIIPTYNRANLIKFTLDSLAANYHTKVSYEVIVVDDGSTDDTLAMIEKDYPGVLLLKNKGKGAASARNTGLAAAHGKYVVYLDSDDLVGENYFKKKITFMEAHPELGACYGMYEYFESEGAYNQNDVIFKHKYPLIFSPDKTNDHLINYLGGNFLPSNAIIWRKNMLVKCGGHDESLKINQDVDLFTRSIFNGLKIAAVDDDSKAYIRTHSLDQRVGDPKNEKNKWLDILNLRKKIYNELGEYGYSDDVYYKALSNYLFGYWKKLRHTDEDIAGEYLKFARQVHWPPDIKGNSGYRLLSKLAGPAAAVKIKYFLLKRD